MSLTTENNKGLPDFKSLDELLEFFDSHDLGEYWDQMPEAAFEVDIQRKTHLGLINEQMGKWANGF